MIGRLAGKVAVVTGGGSSLGDAVAQRYAAEGATVVVVDRDRNAAEAIARRNGATGAASLGLAVDVTDADQVAAAFEQMAAEIGQVDVLCNSAGVLHMGTILDCADDEWERCLADRLVR